MKHENHHLKKLFKINVIEIAKTVNKSVRKVAEVIKNVDEDTGSTPNNNLIRLLITKVSGYGTV